MNKIIIPIILLTFSLIPSAFASSLHIDSDKYYLGESMQIWGNAYPFPPLRSNIEIVITDTRGNDITFYFETITHDDLGGYEYTYAIPDDMKAGLKEIRLITFFEKTDQIDWFTYYHYPNPDDELNPTDIPDDEPPTIPEPTKKSSGGCSDCTPPTLAYDSDGIKRVDNGVCINGTCMDGGKYHTEYPMQYTTLYHTNTISTIYYENQGPTNIILAQLGIGIKEVGSPLSESDAIIEVWIDYFKDDIYNPIIEQIIIVDKNEILQNVNATISLVPCMQDSIIDNGCLSVDFTYQYVKPPTSTVLVTNAMDTPRNTFNNYINDGLLVIHDEPEPEPTPKPEPKCKDPPLSEINVPTRNNCHFRALVSFWN